MNIHLAQALDNGYTDANSTFDGLNHFPDAYVITQPPDVSADFHTYAVQLSPNSVKWYVDNQLVRTVLGHVPPKDMHLIIDLAVAPWWPPNDPNNSASTVSFPSTYEIDYIRAYRSQTPEFLWQWGNGGTSKLDLWNIAPSADLDFPHLFHYRTTTLNGSSGAPIYDQKRRVVGIHIGERSETEQLGVSFQPIFEDLVKDGVTLPPFRLDKEVMDSIFGSSEIERKRHRGYDWRGDRLFDNIEDD